MDVGAVLAAILSAAILASMPLMLAACGESIGERAGILNLGIEGTMLITGFIAFRVTFPNHPLVVGLLAAAATGLVVGAVFGVLVVVARADQVLAGLGLTLGGAGLTSFLFRETYGANQPLLDHGFAAPFAGMGRAIPVVGDPMFGQSWLVYATWGTVLGSGLVLSRTNIGLRLRAVGEAPFAVDAAGRSVVGLRLLATTVAGGFSGLAGAALVLADIGFFRPNIAAGAGFIAVAIAMLARLTPWRVLAASLAFGVLEGLGSGIQLTRLHIAPDFLQLLPYVGVVIALLVGRHHVALPAALGRPFRRGLRTDE